AYLITYTFDPEYAQRRGRYVFVFLIGTALLSLIWLLLRRWVASLRRLETISTGMGEGLYLLSARGVITDVNANACTLLGYPRRALVGADPHTLFHDHNGARQETCPIRVDPVRGGSYRSDEEVFRRGDGSLMRVGVTAAPLRERSGITGSIVMFSDISAEYAHRRHLRLVETAFQNLDEAIMVADGALCISAVNAAFTRITGYSENDVLGQNPSLLDSGLHDIAFYAVLWAQLQRDGRWAGEVWSRRKSGELYPQRLRITAVADDSPAQGSYVAVGNDVSELRDKDDQLQQLIDRDQLTGLYNRSAFLDFLGQRIAHVSEHGRGLALLYLNLDRFQRINETLGHRVGDDMIGLVAERLRGAVGSRDAVGRIGDDEFAILLDDLEQSRTPSDVANQLLALIREPLVQDDNSVHLSASIGICHYPKDGNDAATLLKNADAAMRQAKHQGRDGYRYFNSVLAIEADRRFLLERELRQALDKGELRLHYQPKIALPDGAVSGFEALLRWQHPERGLLSPAHFLDAARDAGLVQPINAWVVYHAARQAAAWRDGRVGAGRVACNVDGSLVFDPQSLLKLLMDSVDAAQISPDELELEIVETAMSQSVVGSDLWQQLATLGFELAIDDFGIGESSFSRLKQLPVNTLKIDRNFVRDIDTDDNSRSIVRALIAMSHTLGKRVVAEGVETAAQLDFLVAAGCHGAQGHLIGHPMPADEVEGFLRHYHYENVGIRESA
ncbi:MAG: EAL domain-containing protein, partial [Thiohalocapsa sp.]